MSEERKTMLNVPGTGEVVLVGLRGVYCPHGARVMCPDRADGSFVVTSPWPCTVCTPEDLDAAMGDVDTIWPSEVLAALNGEEWVP